MSIPILLGVICGAFALGFVLGRATPGMKHPLLRRTPGTVTTLTPHVPALRVIAGGRRLGTRR